jgi:hypothetical protein
LQAKLAQRGDKRAFNASFSKTLQELGNASELVILWITFNYKILIITKKNGKEKGCY